MSSPRDAWLRALVSVAAAQRDPGLTLPALVEAVALEHGERPALLGAGECMTYAGLVRRAHEVAAWAAAHHSAAKLGLLMSNRPQYVATWLGLTRAGCTVALVATPIAFFSAAEASWTWFWSCKSVTWALARSERA